MKMPTNGAVIQKSESFPTSNFRAEISQHAFNVLSSGLYSNKIRAIVRELSCNAWDSHVEAGTTNIPFHLSLPNSLSPRFSIRDFGVGLSPDAVRDVFTVYFKSTKQSTNDLTGCFGLGSKSPFAYTKKFTVVSFFNHKRYYYNAIINEEGFPQMVQVSVTDTVEANGLEISFFVTDRYDIASFKNEAMFALDPFPVGAFKVTGVTDFHVTGHDRTVLLEGPGWRAYKKGPYGLLTARMGNVDYPVVAQTLFSNNASLMLRATGLVVDFPLGSFEVAPSREAIQWTKFSTANVSDRLEEVYEEVLAEIEKRIVNSRTLWDAHLAANATFRGPAFSFLRGNVSIKWKGHSLHDTIAIPKEVKVRSYSTSYSGRTRDGLTTKVRDCTRVTPSASTEFYVDNCKKSNSIMSFYVRKNRITKDVYLLTVRTQKELKAFFRATGLTFSNLKWVSDLPSPPKKVRVSKTGATYKETSRSKAFSFVGGYGRPSDNWKETKIDVKASTGTNLYVEIRHWKPIHRGMSRSLHEFVGTITPLKTLGILAENDTVTGVRTSGLKRFEKSPHWETLPNAVQRKVGDLMQNDKEFCHAYDLYKGEISSAFERKAVQEMSGMLRPLVTQLGSSSYVGKVITVLSRLEKKRSLVNAVERLSDYHSCDLSTLTRLLPHGVSLWRYERDTSKSDKIKDCKLIKGIYERYPLLSSLEKADTKHVLSYIKAMDMYNSSNSK